MKQVILLAIGFSLFNPTVTFGHGDGHRYGPAIKKEEAQTKALEAVKGKVKSGKLEKSWSNTDPGKPFKKSFGHGPEWVVTFDNPKIKDKAKQKLYVFVSMQGQLTGMNFTGK